MPTLICKRVTFFSDGDEKSFFDWLGRIRAVRKWRGEGDSLLLHVSRRVSAVGYRELSALFQRYGVDRKQLRQLTPRSVQRVVRFHR